MNVWNFTGNLGNDAEQRYTPNGDSIVSFSVGAKAGFGDKANTVWARCTMFGKRGESLLNFLNKGQLVGISGEMNAREWIDKEGQKRTSIEVRVNDVTLLGKRDSGAQNANHAPQQPQRSAQATQSPADIDSDVPF